MYIVVLCDAALKQELAASGTATEAKIIWVENPEQLLQYHDAEAVIDLLFEPDAKRIDLLKSLLPETVIINSVIHTLQDTSDSFIRINGWPTLLSSQVTEGSCMQEDLKKSGEQVMSLFNKTIEWLPDEPGFVTPRVISMIVNEAFFALQENISTPEEMDTAMKLGTAYPYGPFEWGKKIGLQKIVSLLSTLSVEQQRYTPCERLVQEMNKDM